MVGINVGTLYFDVSKILKIMKRIRQLAYFPEIGALLSSITSLEVPTVSLSAVTTPHFIRLMATRFILSVYSKADGTLCRYFSESHTTNNM